MSHFARWWYANQSDKKYKTIICKKCNRRITKYMLTEDGCINCDVNYHRKKREKKND